MIRRQGLASVALALALTAAAHADGGRATAAAPDAGRGNSRPSDAGATPPKASRSARADAAVASAGVAAHGRDAGRNSVASGSEGAVARGGATSSTALAARGSSAADAGAVQRGAGPAAQSAVDLASVLQQLSRIEALSARFREEKRMALLAQPLISEGSLHYEKPRKLARHSERPRASSMVLSGDVLTFGDLARSESIGLSSQPALRVLVDTFVSVLAGDRAALERVAEISLESTSSGYRIRVVPKDPGVKRLVRSMAFEGQGALLSRMEVLDATGDLTVTTFSNVTLRKRFSEGERSRLFRIGG